MIDIASVYKKLPVKMRISLDINWENAHQYRRKLK